MQHISLTEAQDMVPMRCPACGKLVCERVGRLQTERAVQCRSCDQIASLEQLIAASPALGRVLSARSSMRAARGGA